MRPRGPEVPLGTTVGAGAQTSRRPRRPRLCPSAVGLTLQTAPKRRAFAAPGMLLGTEDAGGVGLALGTWASLRPAPGRGRSSWGCWGELGPRRGRSRGPPPPGGMHAASPAPLPARLSHGASDRLGSGICWRPEASSRSVSPPRATSGAPPPARPWLYSLGSEKGPAPSTDGPRDALHTRAERGRSHAELGAAESSGRACLGCGHRGQRRDCCGQGQTAYPTLSPV